MKLGKISPWISSPGMNVLIGGIGLLTGILLARTLGPSDRGVLAESLLWPSFVLVLGAIVNTQTIVYFWTKAKSGDHDSRQSVLGTSLVIASLLTFILIIVGLGINFLALGLSNKESFWFANIYLISIPLSLFSACFVSIFLAEERYNIFWGLRISQSIVYLVGLLALILFGNLEILNVILVILAAMLVQTIAAIVLYLKDFRFHPSVNRELSVPLLKYGTRTNLAGLPYHLNTRIDQLFMSLLLAPQVLGYYVVAYGWASLLSFLGGGASMVMLPQSASSEGSNQDSVLLLVSKFRKVLIALAIAGLAAAITAPIGIKILFGAEFAPAILPATILCIAGIVLNSNLVIHEMARGLGYPGLGMWAEGIGLIFTVILLYVLLPLWGGVGAAIASLVSYSIVFIVIVFLLSRRVKISTRSFLPRLSDINEYRIWSIKLVHSWRSSNQ